ncbi:MAG TPA: hypothetical protein VMM59_06315 [Thermohalobaculum sp.]|nr:hypothetical protein [Thermohalobaculum sp.]
MGAQFGSARPRPRATPERRGLALDLTPDEVVLYEGGAAQGWRRFAGVALEDPEFLAVIGLLRAEAESELGAAGPVRLWLPGDQVLSLPARLGEHDPDARLRAAFRQAGRETGHAAADIAVALAPPGPAGTTTVLVTYATTWHEARDYAGRWGFVPGPVSTRHRADDFGPQGPVFQLDAALRERAWPGRRHPAWLAVAFAAMFWPALPEPAAASQAPAAAPAPVARAPARAPTRTPGWEAGPADTFHGIAAVLPAARPDTPGGPALAAPQPALPLPAAPRPAPLAVPSGPSAEGAAETSGASGASGLAAPPPAPRPARSARASVAPSLFPAAPVAAAGGAAGGGLPADRAALVGIFNFEAGRKALLRLPGGDYRTVAIGDVLDGWRVSAIGVDAMRVNRGAESRTLLLVSR